MDDLEPRLALGIASLLAIAPSGFWERLTQRSKLEGEIEDRLEKARPFLAVIEELSEIQKRALIGAPNPGDRVRTYRLLLGFSKKDLLRLIVDLGLPDS